MLFSKAVLISDSAPAPETSEWPEVLEEHLKEGKVFYHPIQHKLYTIISIKLVLSNYYQRVARCLETIVRIGYNVI